MTLVDGDGRIKLLDQRRAAAQHRALVDRALVGGFAGIERRRLGHQDQPADAGRAAGALPRQRVEAFLEFVAQLRIAQHRGGRRVGGKARKLAAGLDVGKHQRRDVVAVQAGDDRVANERRAVIDELGAQRAGADPGAACELEILGEAAVKHEAFAGIAGVLEPERVTHLVEAFVVEGFLGEVGTPPVARRDVRPLVAGFELAAVGDELQLHAAHRHADVAGLLGFPGARERGRRRLGRAEAGQEDDALAGRGDRHLLQLVPDVPRQARAGVEQHLQRLKKFCRNAASARRYGSSISKPLGTLRWMVGAISRRLRTVASMAPGSGLPSSM